MAKLIGLDKNEKAALVIVECQNQMTNPDFAEDKLGGVMEQADKREIISRINHLAASFRAAKRPVVFCTISLRPNFEGFRVNCLLAAQVVRAGKLIMGSRAAALNDNLVVEDTDIVCNRINGMAAFTGTELDSILKGFDTETVVLAGVSTSIALMGSAIEAVGMGYNVVLAEDCTAGGTAESHDFQIKMHLPYLATISRGDVIADILARQC